jgi:hypothetical protein
MRQITFSKAGQKLQVSVDGSRLTSVELDLEVTAAAKRGRSQAFIQGFRETVLKQLEWKLNTYGPNLRPAELAVIINRFSSEFAGA